MNIEDNSPAQQQSMARQDERSEAKRLRISLIVIAAAQLMLVLDDTIANIALPSIQREFDIPSAMLPWFVNAYILAFGSLLIFGGRLGDVYGRRRILQIGMGLFTIASLLCGIAPSAEILMVSRGIQGVGAALTAPNALGLIATTFPVGKERNSAMATYGAMSALGIVGGVILGGAVTDLLDWRWVFLINVPIGFVILAGSKILAKSERHQAPIDMVGAVTVVSSMFLLTYSITMATEAGWSNVVAIGSLVVAIIFAALFVLSQSRQSSPMMPLSLFRDRNRSGSYASMIFVGMGLMGTFYLLALYMQQISNYSPLMTGIAALPFSIGIIIASIISSKLIEKYPPRVVAMPGLVIAALGMVWLANLEVGSTYIGHIMPALFITSFGLGMAAITLTLTAVHGVDVKHVGIASALLNTSQQIGAALGLAIFTAIATTASQVLLPDAAIALTLALKGGDAGTISSAKEALTHGYAYAFSYGAAFLLFAALLLGVSINTNQTQKAN
jgi:EmrB/QacA subfamily drug resistance transporter